MPPGIGYSRDIPLAGEGGGPQGQPPRGLSPQEAVTILSLRIPDRPAQGQIAPLPLLTSPGSAVAGAQGLDAMMQGLIEAFPQLPEPRPWQTGPMPAPMIPPPSPAPSAPMPAPMLPPMPAAPQPDPLPMLPQPDSGLGRGPDPRVPGFQPSPTPPPRRRIDVPPLQVSQSAPPPLGRQITGERQVPQELPKLPIPRILFGDSPFDDVPSEDITGLF